LLDVKGLEVSSGSTRFTSRNVRRGRRLVHGRQESTEDEERQGMSGTKVRKRCDLEGRDDI
jgi:hypothetical protein